MLAEGHNRKPLAPIPCKCGLEWPSKGAQQNHLRQHPECHRTRAESRALYNERWPERAAESYKRRQERFFASPKGQAKRALQETRRTPDQRRSRWMVQLALREGRLTRLPCQECGTEPAQGHHHNGYEPGHELDLVWLCPKHHSAAHRAMKVGE